MAIRGIPMPLNLVVRQYLWHILQTGVKYGNLADNQVEKSGHPAAILGVRMPGCPLIWYTAGDHQGHQRVQLSENLDLKTLLMKLWWSSWMSKVQLSDHLDLKNHADWNSNSHLLRVQLWGTQWYSQQGVHIGEAVNKQYELTTSIWTLFISKLTLLTESWPILGGGAITHLELRH